MSLADCLEALPEYSEKNSPRKTAAELNFSRGKLDLGDPNIVQMYNFRMEKDIITQ